MLTTVDKALTSIITNGLILLGLWMEMDMETITTIATAIAMAVSSFLVWWVPNVDRE